MNVWPFVIGAYAAALLGTGGLFVVSYVAMRRAEQAAKDVGRRE